MIVQQFYLEALGHASYLIGSEQTGEALVFDPERRVDAYFEDARARGMRIAYAMDSHGHNDYLSGLSELSARQPVTVLGAHGARLGYDHKPVQAGETVDFGEVRLEVLATPGHTPEHVSLLVYDRSTGDEPALLLSGGALLVGDVARPDLLGDAEDTDRAAREMCRTLQEQILALPDHVEVLPTHVAGSLCGGSIGSRLSTTVGYERRTNELLRRVSDEAGFVDSCLRLEDLPAVPPYWRRMRRENLAGVARLGVLGEPPALSPEDVARAQERGAVVLDARAPEAFGGSHIPGARNVGRGSSFPTWAGTVLPDGAEVVLVLDRAADLWELTWHLLRIGYPPPAGWLAGGMQAWRTEARPLARLPQITVHELRDRLERGELRLLDVRQPAEWSGGHVEGAEFITGAELPERLDDAPGGPLAVMCGSGYRSSVSASVLLAAGRDDVVNVLGGMAAWKQAGYDTVEGRSGPHSRR